MDLNNKPNVDLFANVIRFVSNVFCYLFIYERFVFILCRCTKHDNLLEPITSTDNRSMLFPRRPTIFKLENLVFHELTSEAWHLFKAFFVRSDYALFFSCCKCGFFEILMIQMISRLFYQIDYSHVRFWNCIKYKTFS